MNLWIAGIDAAGGYGGWAWVAVQGPEAQGVAGGGRRTTARTMALTALTDAVKTLGAGPFVIHAADPGLRALKALRAAGWKTPEGQPLGTPELWDALAAVLDKTAGWSFAPGHKEGTVFVDAWAAFALDIARGKGTFSSAIPKPNMKTLVGKLAG